MLENSCAVVLAGGEGKRIRKDSPKVLEKVLFEPMLKWVLDAVKAAGIVEICVVTGSQHEAVERFLGGYGEVETVYQAERLGTGHAALQAAGFLERHAGCHVLVLNGDTPLIDAEVLHAALERHEEERRAATVITAYVSEPENFGRVLRDGSGRFCGVVEERDADAEEKNILEVNTGAYWFEADELLAVLPRLDTCNSQGEYYLTQALSLLMTAGKRVGDYLAGGEEAALSPGNCFELHALNERARMAVLERLMFEGVEIPCTDGVMVGPGVRVGRGTTLLPGTILRGDTRVGEECVIGPNSLIENSVIGDHVALNAVQCYASEIAAGVTVGPFVHIRPNCRIAGGVKIGDFVEIKNSTIGEGTKVPHLTYVGDSDVGCGVNFGCGCVTVNYDGVNKHRCTVGDHAFIGCNTNLVAPVSVGDNAYTAAGSTITGDVPGDALAIARARQVNKEGWVKKNRE